MRRGRCWFEPLSALSSIAADFHPILLPPAQCLPTSVAQRQSRLDGQGSTPKSLALESESGTRNSPKLPIRQSQSATTTATLRSAFRGSTKTSMQRRSWRPVGFDLQATRRRAIAKCEPFNNTLAFVRRQLVSRSRSHKSRRHVLRRLMEATLHACRRVSPLQFEYDDAWELWREMFPRNHERVRGLTRRAGDLTLGPFTLDEFSAVYAAIVTVVSAHDFLCFCWGESFRVYPLESAVIVRARSAWVDTLSDVERDQPRKVRRRTVRPDFRQSPICRSTRPSDGSDRCCE